MKEKSRSITSKFWTFSALAGILILWQAVSWAGLVPHYMLPSPVDVVKAFFADFGLLMQHARVTLAEAALGLFFGVTVGAFMAVIMELLVLWFGYEMLPKVILIVIVTFFPITVGLLDGFKSADQDMIRLMRSMGAGNLQIFRCIKLPGAMSHFFASLRISVSYSVVGAVISEWLGGFEGLGVYMTRVKKAFSYDKMFAVIFLISIISLLLMKLVDILQKKVMPWEHVK